MRGAGHFNNKFTVKEDSIAQTFIELFYFVITWFKLYGDEPKLRLPSYEFVFKR